MSQSDPYHARAGLDPLLAFSAEQGTAEVAESPTDSPPSAAAAPPAETPALEQRLERAERSLDRALTEIATLKSDLLTLVAAVDDIRKRPSRRVEPVPAVKPVEAPKRRLSGRRVAAAVVTAILGAALWGATTLAML